MRRAASTTVSLTTAASAADTVRAMARLPAASRPVATARLVYSRTSDPGSAAAACRAVAAAASAGRAQHGGHVQLDGGDAGPGPQHGQLAAGVADV